MEEKQSDMERWVRKAHKKKKQVTHKELMTRFKKPLQECDAMIHKVYDITQGGKL